MEKKQTVYKIKGMSRDLNNMSFDKEHSFENKNIRITADKDNGLLSITNEKGTDIIFEEDILKLNRLTFTSEPADTGYTHTIKLEYPVPTGETVDIDVSSSTSNYYSFSEGEDTIIINDVSFELNEVFIAGINTSNTYYYWSESDLTLNDQSSVDVMVKISTIIGYAVVDDSVILFTTTEEDLPYKDFIMTIQEDQARDPLYKGNLNFSTKHPIETLVDIENENLKKVYWVDGVNPLRMISISKSYLEDTSEDPFAFVQPIQFNHTLDVSRIDYGGSFPAGVIQYAFTYFNKFGQESAIVDTTPIYYIAYPDRGAAPNDIVSCSFRIDITNPDINWEYVRIYSIIRTSLNTTPEVKKIVDLPIQEGINITYNDTNNYGENVSDTDLLFKDGEVLTASTLTQKDGTLFLGNIESSNNINIEDSLKIKLKENLKESFSFSLDMRGYNLGPNPIYKGEYNSLNSSGTFYDYKNHLTSNPAYITTFKKGETYRIGVQLQDIYGKWSNPIYVGDFKNEYYPTASVDFEDSHTVNISTGVSSMSDKEFILKLYNLGYRKIRPLIVFPTESERACVAQGIVCPTVYNVEDRLNNQPFAQSSWFLRPNDPNMESNIPLKSDYSFTSYTSSGKWAEFRHNYNIQSDFVNRNGEISDFGYNLSTDNTLLDVQINPYIHSGYNIKTINSTGGEFEIYIPEADKVAFESTYKNNFYVDKNIVTFHSPDLNENTKVEGLKFRIIGITPITSSTSDIEVTASTSEILDKAGLYHVSKKIKSYNKSKWAGRHLINGRYWYDYWYEDGNKYTTLYHIYPWNRSTGLSFTTSNNPTLLEKCRYSIFQYSDNNIVSLPETPVDTENRLWTDNSGVLKFQDGTYYLGEYNKIIALTDAPYGYAGYRATVIDEEDTPVSEEAESYDEYINSINNGSNPINETKDLASYAAASSFHSISRSRRAKTSLIPITYKSSTHAVLKLANDYYIPDELVGDSYQRTETPFWKTGEITMRGIQFKNVEYNEYSYLFLGELYRDIDQNNLFGGTSDYAIQNNLWVPAGEAVYLDGIILWTEGDTYYQRYDHVKTKPYDDTSLNGVTVIASFMCETRTNLDGRYDRNRIQDDYFNITEENYNLINPVYNQQNNYFNYRILDSERFGITKFPSSIVWSKTKLPNSIIDNWLNINMVSTLDLDNSKGPVTSLRRFNNEIIAFQDKGLAQILYNTRTQIPATDGVPIEIANSGKVDGKRYISDNVGCLNKYSICESPNGLYFIDDYNKSINIYNSNGLQSLSEAKGFHSWAINNSSNKAWNPIDFNNVITYRDPINSEILFVYKDTCLVYNELLGEFTSFYDYGKSYPFVSLNGRNFIFNDNVMYGYQEGEYGNIFGVNRDYYIDIIANENPLNDKIFTNIEFRGDTYDSEGKVVENEIDFETLTATTEYQNASHTLEYLKYKPSTLKKKFRIWRADIPRDGRDRIRNTWAHIKLQGSGNRKTRLHDLSVIYYV